MGAIETITIAVGTAGALLTYMGFKLNESDSDLMRVIGSLLFLIAFSFVTGLVWIASQVAENEGIAYLSSGIAPFLIGLTYLFIAIILVVFFKILYSGWRILMKAFMDMINMGKGGGY